VGQKGEWPQICADLYDFRRLDIIDSTAKTLFECINVQQAVFVFLSAVIPLNRYADWGEMRNGLRPALTSMTSADLILSIPVQKLYLNA